MCGIFALAAGADAEFEAVSCPGHNRSLMARQPGSNAAAARMVNNATPLENITLRRTDVGKSISNTIDGRSGAPFLLFG
jgi:hypothetical protein